MSHPYADLSQQLKRKCLRHVRDRLMMDFAASPEGEAYGKACLPTDGGEPDLDDFDFHWRVYADRFLLFGTTRAGERVLASIRRRKSFANEERDVLKEWEAQAFSSVFEVREVREDCFRLFDIVAEVAYDVYSNADDGKPLAAVFPNVAPGMFLSTNLAPVHGVWFLSGGQQLYPPEDGKRLFAEFARNQPPQARYRNNPGKLAQAFALQKEHYDCFVKAFGADEVIVPGNEAPRKEKEYYEAWYRLRNLPGSPPASGDYPTWMLSADTVGLVMDEKEGLHQFVDYGLFKAAFANPLKQKPKGWRRIARGYLQDETVPAFVFRRMKDHYPHEFRRVFKTLFPGMKRVLDPVEEFDLLMDTYKPGWRDNIYPSVHPLSERFEARQTLAQKVGRNEACPCGAKK